MGVQFCVGLTVGARIGLQPRWTPTKADGIDF